MTLLSRRVSIALPLHGALVSIILMFAAGSLQAQALPTPESVLGHKPGDDFYLANYDESLAYFRKLAAASDKIRLFNVGKTSQGRDWYVAVISSAENLQNLDHYLDIAKRMAAVRGVNDEEAHRLAREGKAVVHIDGGLHSTEVAHAQHTIQLAYDLVSAHDDPRIQNILNNVILVLWFSINPDGQNMVVDWYRRNLGTPYEVSPLPWLYQKYVGHDNNRDGYMNNMIESQVVTREAVRHWYPMVFYNHHQTAPFPARIWIPPFAEPVSSNMHPLMWRWTNLFGTAMAAWLDEHGMPGAIHRTGFDDWYPGFIDNVNNYRNTISFLTETALYHYATPHFYTVQDFPKDYQDLRKEVFYSSPWTGGWWRLGDAVRYMIGASMSVLDTAAKYKEDIIYTRYEAGRDVIRQFTQDPPYAYLIPRQQRDPQTAALLMTKLQMDGIQISQATQPVAANGREYPAGTWVIMMDQPYALLVKDLFDIQHYPDLKSPGGGPDLPYDATGWTLPVQMGVEVAAVMAPPQAGFRGQLKVADQIAPPPGSLEGSGPSFVFDHAPNASIKAVNRILAAGGSVTLAGKEISAGSMHFAAGAFVAGGIPPEKMQSIAADLSLKVVAARLNEPLSPIKAPRVGVYSSWVANIDEGWTDWLLEQFEFPYVLLHNADIQAGHLRDRFDAIVIPEMGTAAIMEGHKVGTIPGEYVGGIGEEGLGCLRDFVRSGGTLVALGNASIFAIDKFNLPVKNVLKGLKSEEFFCSGAILRSEQKDGSHPILYGLAANPALFFARSAAFETQRDFRGTVLLSYPKEDNPLVSGLGIHTEKLQGKAAALDVIYGRGRVILTGFRPQWRGQTHGMFKFLFNALYYSTTPGTAPATAAAAPSGRAPAWSKLVDEVHSELEKVFAQNQKFVAAHGSQAVQEGEKLDELVKKFQGAQFAAIDEFKQEPHSPAAKLEEYKTQLKAALLDIRGKEVSAVKFTAREWMVQFRLPALEKEIGDALK